MNESYSLPPARDPARRLAGINLLIVLGGAMLHLLYIWYGPLDLSGDEALYWQYARHLDWSYYHKGPMVGWLIALSTHYLGDTVLGVRLPAVILGAAFMLVVADLAARVRQDLVPAADELDRQKARLWALLLIVSQPMLSAGGILMTIDTPYMLFWALALWGLYRAILQNWKAGWYVAGIAGGLGFLSKYTIALLAGGVLLYILAEGWRNRARLRLLLSPHLWAAAGLATVLTLPVWIWNSQHEWVGLRHVAGQASDGAPFSLVRPLETLGSQALNPITFVLILVVWYMGIRSLKKEDRSRESGGGENAETPKRRNVERGEDKVETSKSRNAEIREKTGGRNQESIFLFLTCMSLPVLLFFMLAAVQTKVQPNWPVALFAGALALVGAWVAQRQENQEPEVRNLKSEKDDQKSKIKNHQSTKTPWKVRLAWVAVAVGLPLVAIGHDTRVLYKLGLDPRIDPASTLMGWSQLGQTVSEVRARHPGLPVVSDHYQTASLMSFYVAGQPYVDLLNFGRRMDQYDLWNHGVIGIPDGGSAIFVGKWETLNIAAPYKLGDFFDQIESINRKQIFREGKTLTEMPWVIVVAHGFRLKEYKAALEKMKVRF